MRRKQLVVGITTFCGMMILILDGESALEGAAAGMELCMKTVIPSLFPFFLLSILLTGALSGQPLPILTSLGKLCGVPEGAESILVAGFLGGYPVGAQCITEAYRSGHLDKTDAQRMLAFCNNAGPAFLFGMTASIFSSAAAPWLLWGIHIASAVAVSLIFPVRTHTKSSIKCSGEISIATALHAAIRSMALVCGWVILFRIVIVFLRKWILWILPQTIQPMIIGILELSNGCIELAAVSEQQLRFIICSGILGFGGLCVLMQTGAVTKGLSIKYYVLGKLLQCVLSIFLSCVLVYQLWIPGFLALCIAIFWIRQKKCSIPAVVGI